MSRTAKGTGPRPKNAKQPGTEPTQLDTVDEPKAPVGARVRDRLGIWWWPATWAAGSVVATVVLTAGGGPYPWLYGPAIAAGISASAAGRHRLVGALGSATSWAAIGLVWAAILAAIALLSPAACMGIDGPVACGPPEVAMWASLGPIVTLAVLFGSLVWRIFSRGARTGARLGATAASVVAANARSLWALRAVEMAGGAAAAAAVAALFGGHGGIILTAAAVGAAISPIVSPFGTRGGDAPASGDAPGGRYTAPKGGAAGKRRRGGGR